MIPLAKKVKIILTTVFIKYDDKILQTFYVQTQKTSWILICPTVCQTLLLDPGDKTNTNIHTAPPKW